MDDFGRIVATAAFPTAVGQREAARRAVALGADRAEVRLDRLRLGEDAEALLALADEIPLLVSGGRRRTSRQERDLLVRAQRRGAWVDLPFDPARPSDLSGLDPSRLVLSWHGSPREAGDLRRLAGRLLAEKAARVKVVLEASSGEEALAVLDLLEEHAGGRLTAFASGYAGVYTRILCLSRGSASVYAAAPGSPPAAEGQPDLRLLQEAYGVGSLRREDPVTGVAGWPLRSTRSPALHNEWLRRLGLAGVFLPFPFERLDSLLCAASRLNLRGLAVTMPHKAAALDRAAAAGRLARRIGAANTLLFRDGEVLLAANTDPFGVRCALRATPPFRRVLLLGAGGAAAAVASALPRGAALAVASRDRERARTLARRFGAEAVPWEKRADAAWDLLVNATPSGQEGEEDPYPFPLAGRSVFDLVVRPDGTPLLSRARAEGLAAVGGETMLEAQARLQFRLFTGLRPPR